MFWTIVGAIVFVAALPYLILLSLVLLGAIIGVPINVAKKMSQNHWAIILGAGFLLAWYLTSNFWVPFIIFSIAAFLVEVLYPVKNN